MAKFNQNWIALCNKTLNGQRLSITYDRNTNNVIVKILLPAAKLIDGLKIRQFLFIYLYEFEVPFYANYEIVFKNITSYQQKENYEYPINEVFAVLEGFPLKQIKYNSSDNSMIIKLYGSTPSDEISHTFNFTEPEIETHRIESPELIFKRLSSLMPEYFFYRFSFFMPALEKLRRVKVKEPNVEKLITTEKEKL